MWYQMKESVLAVADAFLRLWAVAYEQCHPASKTAPFLPHQEAQVWLGQTPAECMVT